MLRLDTLQTVEKPSWSSREAGGFSSTLWSVQRKGRLVFTVSMSLSNCLDLVLPLDSDNLRQESEVDGTQLFFTLNKVISQVITHKYFKQHHLKKKKNPFKTGPLSYLLPLFRK